MRAQQRSDAMRAQKEREREREEQAAQVVAAQEQARMAEEMRRRHEAEVQWEQGFF